MTACAEAAKEEDCDEAAACRSRQSFGGPFTGLILRRQLAFNACHAVEAEDKYQPDSPGRTSWSRQSSQNPSCFLHPPTHRAPWRCSKESFTARSSARRRDRIVTCARSNRVALGALRACALRAGAFERATVRTAPRVRVATDDRRGASSFSPRMSKTRNVGRGIGVVRYVHGDDIVGACNHRVRLWNCDSEPRHSRGARARRTHARPPPARSPAGPSKHSGARSVSGLENLGRIKLPERHGVK